MVAKNTLRPLLWPETGYFVCLYAINRQNKFVYLYQETPMVLILDGMFMRMCGLKHGILSIYCIRLP